MDMRVRRGKVVNDTPPLFSSVRISESDKWENLQGARLGPGMVFITVLVFSGFRKMRRLAPALAEMNRYAIGWPIQRQDALRTSERTICSIRTQLTPWTEVHHRTENFPTGWPSRKYDNNAVAVHRQQQHALPSHRSSLLPDTLSPHLLHGIRDLSHEGRVDGTPPRRRKRSEHGMRVDALEAQNIGRRSSYLVTSDSLPPVRTRNVQLSRRPAGTRHLRLAGPGSICDISRTFATWHPQSHQGHQSVAGVTKDGEMIQPTSWATKVHSKSIDEKEQTATTWKYGHYFTMWSNSSPANLINYCSYLCPWASWDLTISSNQIRCNDVRTVNGEWILYDNKRKKSCREPEGRRKPTSAIMIFPRPLANGSSPAGPHTAHTLSYSPLGGKDPSVEF
ncbi:hypothetical protein EDB83DRAFT_2318249 [Lactarius deliciosus]|nr:hypothetical protein EDB83DRAFT_2318249 [Lactarius deliciosus]